MSSGMSQSAIKEKTNLPMSPRADFTKGSSLEHPTKLTLAPGFAPAHSPSFNTDCTPGGSINVLAESPPPESASTATEPFPPFDPVEAPYEQTDRSAGDEINATADSTPNKGKRLLEQGELVGWTGHGSDMTNPALPHPGVLNLSSYRCRARRMPPGGARYHPYLGAERLLTEHGAGPSQQPPNGGDNIRTFGLQPPATEDAESSSSGSLDAISMNPYEPTARTPLRDENEPLSPGGAIESPPGLSHTINYHRGDDMHAPRAHTVGTGPNAPGLTSPLPPRFFESENEYVRGLVNNRWNEDQDKIRTTLGNAVATQEARKAGVEQRDFAAVVERPSNARGPAVTNPHEYDDREETNMVDPYEAMLMNLKQKQRWAEYWHNGQIQRLWLNP